MEAEQSATVAPQKLPDVRPIPELDSSQKPPLLWSERNGKPTYILDPQDLPGQPSIAPNKMCATIKLIDTDLIVKYGEGFKLSEAEAMHPVSYRITVKVPRVEAAYVLEGVGYIIMSLERGKLLNRYSDSATDAQRENVIMQLKDYVDQLRQIKGQFIGSVDSSPCQDAVFEWDHQAKLHEYGPFDSQSAFNEGIVKALEITVPLGGVIQDPESSAYNKTWMLKQLVRSFKSHEMVLTHGDLRADNIIIRHDGAVTLIDWELAGFWPEYWEFYRATFNGQWREDFMRQLERFIPPFYKEAYIMRKFLDVIIG